MHADLGAEAPRESQTASTRAAGPLLGHTLGDGLDEGFEPNPLGLDRFGSKAFHEAAARVHNEVPEDFTRDSAEKSFPAQITPNNL